MACTSTCCLALSPPTLQVDLPAGTQTENVGDTKLGDADSVILAVPLVPLLSHTQTAYPTVACGFTELTLSRAWTFRHKVPSGGLVGVVVGVGVAVDVGVGVGLVDVGVALGDWAVPPGVRGCVEVVLCAGAGCGSVVLAAAVTIAVARLSLRRQPPPPGKDGPGSS